MVDIYLPVPVDHLIYCSVKCYIIVSLVPKVGFGTAGLFKDTKSSVLVALSSGYRYLFINIKLRKLFNISLSAVLSYKAPYDALLYMHSTCSLMKRYKDMCMPSNS